MGNSSNGDPIQSQLAVSEELHSVPDWSLEGLQVEVMYPYGNQLKRM